MPEQSSSRRTSVVDSYKTTDQDGFTAVSPTHNSNSSQEPNSGGSGGNISLQETTPTQVNQSHGLFRRIINAIFVNPILRIIRYFQPNQGNNQPTTTSPIGSEGTGVVVTPDAQNHTQTQPTPARQSLEDSLKSVAELMQLQSTPASLYDIVQQAILNNNSYTDLKKQLKDQPIDFESLLANIPDGEVKDNTKRLIDLITLMMPTPPIEERDDSRLTKVKDAFEKFAFEFKPENYTSASLTGKTPPLDTHDFDPVIQTILYHQLDQHLTNFNDVEPYYRAFNALASLGDGIIKSNKLITPQIKQPASTEQIPGVVDQTTTTPTDETQKNKARKLSVVSMTSLDSSQKTNVMPTQPQPLVLKPGGNVLKDSTNTSATSAEASNPFVIKKKPGIK